MRNLKRLKFAVFLLFGSLVASSIVHADDNKVDVLFGYYSLSFVNSSTAKTTAIASPGAFQVRYRRDFDRRFDFGAGYSLNQTQIISGDSYFGLDLLADYYPLTSSHTDTSSVDGVSVSFTEKIRPYVGVSFHQRSFQGIQTSATGFALSLGTEYTLSPGMSLVLNLRYMSLKASSLIQGTETAFQSGLSFGF